MNLFFDFLKQRKVAAARLVGNGLGQAASNIVTVIFIQRIFDGFIVSDGAAVADGLTLLGAGLITAGLFGAWLRFDERVQSERLGQDFVHRLRLRLFNHLAKVSPRVRASRAQGGVMLRFVSDLTALRQWVSLGLARLIVAGVGITGTLLALFFINWQLALMVSAVVTLGGVVSLVLGKPVEAAVREARKTRTYLANNVTEKLSAMTTVQVHRQRSREVGRIGKQSKRLQKAMVQRARLIGALRGVTQGTIGLASAGTLLLGVAQVSTGNASPGTVVAAMSIVGLLLMPLRHFGRVYEYWHSARVSQQKISEILALPHMTRRKQQTKRLRRSAQRIEFQQVTVPGALDKFGAIAQPGRKIAIVGPNGSGKSTLFGLVMRLIEPEKGKIMLDGVDVRSIRRSSLLRAIGIMSPDVPLLRGSIRKNLCYRHPGASEEEINHVCQITGVDEILSKLPQGDQTRLTERGLNLSLGERQRLSLARALLGAPKILLLDEADANLDTGAKTKLAQILSSYDGTVLLITHDQEFIDHADEIWHLDHQPLMLIENRTPTKPVKVDRVGGQENGGSRI